MTARVQHFAIYRTFTGRIISVGRSTKTRRVVCKRGESVVYTRTSVNLNRHRVLDGRITDKPARAASVELIEGEAHITPPEGALCLDAKPSASGVVLVKQSNRPRVIRFRHPDYFVPAVRVRPLSRADRVGGAP